jgi:hypothetical protein
VPMLTTSPANTLQHMRQLASAGFHDVVRPNSDTIYSKLVVDLSHHDLVFNVPGVHDRYWAFSFYDV